MTPEEMTQIHAASCPSRSFSDQSALFLARSNALKICVESIILSPNRQSHQVR